MGRRKDPGDVRYYAMRASLPQPTCPDLNLLKAKLKGDKEAEAAIERLREAHNALRLASKASMLLVIKLDELLEGRPTP